MSYIKYITYIPGQGKKHINRTGICLEQDFNVDLGDNSVWLEVLENVSTNTHYIDENDEVCAYTLEQLNVKNNKPGFYYSWDIESLSWQDARALNSIKQEQIANIKEQALIAVNNDLVVNNMTFKSSLEIRAELAQELALAQAEGASYSLEWEFADGTPVTLTGVQVRNLLRAMSTRASTIRTKLRNKLQLINAATTKEEVEAVTW
jgi:hypothetical protein